jgi:TPR repeat protein
VAKDVRKAYELMLASAAQDYPAGVGGIGYFHAAGIVVTKDEVEAAKWFRNAAEKGAAIAQLNLGRLLVSGKGGIGRSLDDLREEGLEWIKKAADQGFAEAASAYGHILYQGDHGQKRDPKAAAPYLKLAAGQGVADAQNALGVMHESGDGVPYDPALAGEWLKKSALQGNAKAQGNYGALLNPLSEDRPVRGEALAWLILATANGDVLAKRTLQDNLPALKDGEYEEAKILAEELKKTIGKK